MKENLAKQDEEEEKSNILPFLRPATGGGFNGGGGNIISDIWLENMDEGTVFVAKEKNTSGFLLPCFILSRKFTKAYVLMQDTGQGGHVHLWVDPRRFCNRYELVEILQVLDRPEEQETENTDGSNQRALLTGTVEGHEVPGVIPSDDEAS